MSRLGARGLGASTLASYSMVAGQSLRTLLVARVLGPAEFGVLTMANVGTNFSMYADIGTGMVGEQNASHARGRGDADAARAHLVATTRARMWAALGLSAVLAVLTAVLVVTGQDRAARATAFVAVSGPLQMLWFSCRGWLRVMHEFRLAMQAQLAQVAVWVLVVPLVAWRWGLVGALVAMAASYLPPVLACARVVPLAVLLRPSLREFRGLLRAGLPVWGLAVSNFAMIYVDQVLVAVLLGAGSVGLYAIAMLVANAILALSDGAAAAAHPQTLEAFGRHGRLAPDEPSVVRVMAVVRLLFLVLVPLSWLAMAIVAQFFLTDYTAALPIVALLGPVSVLIGIPTASNAALLAVGLHRRVPPLFLLGTAVKIGIALAAVQLTRDPVIVGVASWCGTAVYAALYLSLVARALGLGGSAAGGFVARQLAVAVLLSVSAFVAAWAYARDGVPGFVWAGGITLLLTSALAAVGWRRRG